jgi:predicted dinucleotide-binding enzyme
MKIAILGAGNVGIPLAKAFAGAGHDVQLANSRGPESIRDLAASLGASAASAAEAVRDAEAIVISVNPGSYGRIRPLLADVPEDVPVIDTGNYHPLRDGNIAAMDNGQIEAIWISEQLGRPVTKAWNTLTSMTMVEKPAPAGSPGRIAISVAGDNADARELAATLTDISGFDPVDIGSLDNSWRTQPGNPAYCTELPVDAFRVAVERADAATAPIRRNLMHKIFDTFGEDLGREDVVRVFRAVTRTPDPV